MKLLHLLESVRLFELQHAELGELRSVLSGGIYGLDEIVNWLGQRGWERIGDPYTSYSQVFGRDDSSWVIKVLVKGEDMRTDAATRCGLQWLRKSQKASNPHYPRVAYIQSVGRLSSKWGDDHRFDRRSYVAVMERLDEVNPSDVFDVEHLDAKEALLYMSVLWHFDIGWDRRMDHLVLELDAEVDLGMVASSVPELMEEVFQYAVQVGYPFAVAVADALSLGCETDLHLGNVMRRRGTGELVITDPVVG